MRERLGAPWLLPVSTLVLLIAGTAAVAVAVTIALSGGGAPGPRPDEPTSIPTLTLPSVVPSP